jgi:hypothetical protein
MWTRECETPDTSSQLRFSAPWFALGLKFLQNKPIFLLCVNVTPAMSQSQHAFTYKGFQIRLERRGLSGWSSHIDSWGPFILGRQTQTHAARKLKLVVNAMLKQKVLKRKLSEAADKAPCVSA